MRLGVPYCLFTEAQILATEWTQMLDADSWCPTWNARLCSDENEKGVCISNPDG